MSVLFALELASVGCLIFFSSNVSLWVVCFLLRNIEVVAGDLVLVPYIIHL